MRSAPTVRTYLKEKYYKRVNFLIMFCHFSRIIRQIYQKKKFKRHFYMEFWKGKVVPSPLAVQLPSKRMIKRYGRKRAPNPFKYPFCLYFWSKKWKKKNTKNLSIKERGNICPQARGFQVLICLNESQPN